MAHAAGLELTAQELLGSQRLAVLATEADGTPYSSLIAFAASPDFGFLVFATPRLTRKFSNLCRNPHVALLVDNRSNREEDFANAAAVTVLGTAREAEGERREDCLALFLGKHPYLASFARSPGCAILRVDVESCHVVNRFQPVTDLQVRR
jgi:nitroimidazol reductase NimA-like FMN-containing flavoprotein (pyridoxamine 5'-phosphate oxidase superfamily)